MLLITFNSLFCLLGLSEGNQKFEKQIIKGNLNKAIKYGSNQIVKPVINLFKLNFNA